MDVEKNEESKMAEEIKTQDANDTQVSEVNSNEIASSSIVDQLLKETDDELADIDLSSISISPSAIDESLDDPDFAKANEVFQIYGNIMDACSTTAQALKKTITDVLSSREQVIVIDDNPENDFELSLNQKIADFENVVSGCFTMKHGSGIPNPVTITEIVEEPYENSVSTVDAPDNSTNIKSCEGPVSSEEPCDKEKKESPKEQVVVPESSDTSLKKDNADASVVNEDIKKNSTDVTAAVVEDVKKNNTVQCTPEVKKTSSAPKHSQLVDVPKEQTKQPALDEKPTKKQQKAASNKKKGDKTVDQVMKSLANCSTTEEKLQTLCKRYIDTLEELRLVEPRLKQLERQLLTQQREKEQLQTEHNRMILAKSRLESLCRELQRQNRAVKEESLLRIKEEEEKRKEVASKFQVTLNDISALMQEHSKKNIALREENAELAKKLKSIVDHYEMWEKHMEKVMKQKDLEAQLAKAKQAKINLLLKQETEKYLREKQALLENMSELQKKCTMLTTNELQLRTELGDYTSKYEEFQSVLNKSSQVFASFKNDMEATSKKIKKLEKETNIYKQKWEGSNKALLEMINEKQKHDKELMNAQQRIGTLEKLCRALQAERNELRNQMNVLSSKTAKPAEDSNVPSNDGETSVA